MPETPVLERLRAAAGVCAAGMCPVSALALEESRQTGLARVCPDAKTVLAALFPYYNGQTPGNLSLYARGRDYHEVIREALAPVVLDFQETYPHARFAILADDSPLPEVALAARAGLGVIGDNGLLIHPVYGSFVFIGTIVTDLDLGAEAMPVKGCLHCGACRRACPGGALTEEGFFDTTCLSALTQKGGALTDDEAALVRAHDLVWGCDRCQTVCPLNKDVPLTENPAFTDKTIHSLCTSDLDGLTRRAFLEKYPGRAFTWKGPAPLRRNLTLKNGD